MNAGVRREGFISPSSGLTPGVRCRMDRVACERMSWLRGSLFAATLNACFWVDLCSCSCSPDSRPAVSSLTALANFSERSSRSEIAVAAVDPSSPRYSCSGVCEETSVTRDTATVGPSTICRAVADAGDGTDGSETEASGVARALDSPIAALAVFVAVMTTSVPLNVT